MSRGERKGGLLGLVVNCLSSQSLGARGVKVAAMRTAVGPLLPSKGGPSPQYACSPGMCYAQGLWVSKPAVIMAWSGR